MGFNFSEIYIGGGTPTILMDELGKTLSLINTLFEPKEISVETNPDMLDRDVLLRLAVAGVGRVSVGIQTFNDRILQMIGRYEKFGSGNFLKTKIASAKELVRTLNVDMIYNYPAQQKEDLIQDIAVLNEIMPSQITFYPLMLSEKTIKKMTSIMGKHSLKKERDFYRVITENLSQLYKPMSAWCFSISETMTDEYVTSTDDYVGAGSGAFGLVGGSIYANTFSISKYITELDHGRLPLYGKKAFSRKELARYTFLMGLFGLNMPRSAFRLKFGGDIWGILPLECMFFTMLQAIKISPANICLTEKGRYLWVIMMREFFTGVDNFRDMSRQDAGCDI
jgi:coproporphyrinogen III oxidase-like Fe-S oxidoreductase